MDRPFRIMVTCEHGGNGVPSQYRSLFAGCGSLLSSHRAYDPGALELSKTLARELSAAFFSSTVTRLLIDLNRSPGNTRLFSEFSEKLQPHEKTFLIERYYQPYRDAIFSSAEGHIRKGKRMLHLAVHSFAPELDGITRNADMGLLYDPRRQAEAAFCSILRKEIMTLNQEMRVRRNYPYLGRADGMATFLRKHFPEDSYLGIELEFNQKFPQGDRGKLRALKRTIVQSLSNALQHLRR